MSDEQMIDLGGMAKLAESELVKQVYADGLREGTSELGQLFGQLSKTARMAVQPVLTAIQGSSSRLNSWICQAVGDVPPERLIEAKPGLLRDVIQAVAVEDDQSEMRNNYVKLLASMMDSDRQKDVHPAFPKLLRELSSLDALLLQITPYGSEVRLPNGFEQPTYKFSSGLVATWETWQEQGQTVGKYRFFCQIKKRPLEENGKTVGSKKSDEHMGFVEIELEQSQLFRDKGLGWHNLQRLGLVSEHRESDLSGKLVELFYRDPEALRQIKGISRNPDFFFGQRMYHRTELGRAFAKCCTPVYTGEQIWHSFVHD